MINKAQKESYLAQYLITLPALPRVLVAYVCVSVCVSVRFKTNVNKHIELISCAFI